MAITKRSLTSTHSVVRYKRRPFGGSPKKVVNKTSDVNPQLALIFATSPQYERSQPVPHEILMKIFHEVIKKTNNPIRELCSLANVCEAWRISVLRTPTLWSRINFDHVPLTDGNFRVLNQLLNKLPDITKHVEEVTLQGPVLVRSPESLDFLEKILAAPKFNELTIDRLVPQGRAGAVSQVLRAIGKSHRLKKLSFKNSRDFFTDQRWISDYLTENGHQLEELHLTSSLRFVSPQLFRALGQEFCPSLRVLDLSTCDFLCNKTFDAVVLAQTMPHLVVLRLANVSFRRVHARPEERPGLLQLEELSMPINHRDVDRDDVLFATLTHEAENINLLDLRGSSVTPYALMNMISYNLRELHIDDICPLNRCNYKGFIQKWQRSLRVLSLVKINCSKTIRSCLEALISDTGRVNIREVDLESSDVTEEDLKSFLTKTQSSLRMINLSSCRSLPRGCKGRYSETSCADNAQPMSILIRRLGVLETHSESETEIDEENSWDSLNGVLPRKRRRVAKQHRDYVTY